MQYNVIDTSVSTCNDVAFFPSGEYSYYHRVKAAITFFYDYMQTTTAGRCRLRIAELVKLAGNWDATR